MCTLGNANNLVYPKMRRYERVVVILSAQGIPWSISRPSALFSRCGGAGDGANNIFLLGAIFIHGRLKEVGIKCERD